MTMPFINNPYIELLITVSSLHFALIHGQPRVEVDNEVHSSMINLEGGLRHAAD